MLSHLSRPLPDRCFRLKGDTTAKLRPGRSEPRRGDIKGRRGDTGAKWQLYTEKSCYYHQPQNFTPCLSLRYSICRVLCILRRYSCLERGSGYKCLLLSVFISRGRTTGVYEGNVLQGSRAAHPHPSLLTPPLSLLSLTLTHSPQPFRLWRHSLVLAYLIIDSYLLCVLSHFKPHHIFT